MFLMKKTQLCIICIKNDTNELPQCLIISVNKKLRFAHKWNIIR